MQLLMPDCALYYYLLLCPFVQGRSENSTRVKMSRAAGQLLWHAPEENPAEQEAHVWRDRSQAQGSGACHQALVFCCIVFKQHIFYIHLCALLKLLVLKYVQNKDVFMRYHKAHLTRRLILDISADSEIEENMVEWLRVRDTGGDVYCSLYFLLIWRVL